VDYVVGGKRGKGSRGVLLWLFLRLGMAAGVTRSTGGQDGREIRM
jgi:hypothetical protein